MDNGDNVTLGDIMLRPDAVTYKANKVLFVQNSDNVHVDGVKAPGLINKHRPFSFSNVTNYSVRGCQVTNAGPATQLCEVAVFTNCDEGEISGNRWDGGLSPYTALTLDGTTDTIVEANRSRIATDAAARPTVSMKGTCTGTIYGVSNRDCGGRMENSSTGGSMHTRDTGNGSGGKMRQRGDTIENTAPTTGGVAKWFKVAASSGAATWEKLNLVA